MTGYPIQIKGLDITNIIPRSKVLDVHGNRDPFDSRIPDVNRPWTYELVLDDTNFLLEYIPYIEDLVIPENGKYAFYLNQHGQTNCLYRIDLIKYFDELDTPVFFRSNNLTIPEKMYQSTYGFKLENYTDGFLYRLLHTWVSHKVMEEWYILKPNTSFEIHNSDGLVWSFTAFKIDIVPFPNSPRTLLFALPLWSPIIEL